MFTEQIEIDTSVTRLWAFLVDIERWWLASNPDHQSLDIVDGDGPVGPGSRIRIREKIAGIPGEALGEVTEFVVGDHMTWEAGQARYRLWGIPLQVREGVRWQLRPHESGRVALSATVWAEFPEDWKGRIAEWLFTGPLRGERRDRRHARRELEYIRRQLEGG